MKNRNWDAAAEALLVANTFTRPSNVTGLCAACLKGDSCSFMVSIVRGLSVPVGALAGWLAGTD